MRGSRASFGGGGYGARGGGGRAFNAPRDPLLTKTVILTEKPYKGYRGTVVAAMDGSVRVELQTNNRKVLVDRNKVREVEYVCIHRLLYPPPLLTTKPVRTGPALRDHGMAAKLLARHQQRSLLMAIRMLPPPPPPTGKLRMGLVLHNPHTLPLPLRQTMPTAHHLMKPSRRIVRPPPTV